MCAEVLTSHRKTESAYLFETKYRLASFTWLNVAENAARNNKPVDNSSFASSSPPSSNTSASNSSLASSGTSTDEAAVAENVFDVLIFKASDVVYLKAKDVDLDYGELEDYYFL